MFSSVDQILICQHVCVGVCYHVDVCGRVGAHGCFLWENGESEGWEVSVSGGVTLGMRWGQIRGKCFSINSFTAAISCKREETCWSMDKLDGWQWTFLHPQWNQFRSVELYLRTGHVRKPCVGFEGGYLRIDYPFEFFCRHGTKLHWDHDVTVTVALQDREVLVATWCLQTETTHT